MPEHGTGTPEQQRILILILIWRDSGSRPQEKEARSGSSSPDDGIGSQTRINNSDPAGKEPTLGSEPPVQNQTHDTRFFVVCHALSPSQGCLHCSVRKDTKTSCHIMSNEK